MIPFEMIPMCLFEALKEYLFLNTLCLIPIQNLIFEDAQTEKIYGVTKEVGTVILKWLHEIQPGLSKKQVYF